MNTNLRGTFTLVGRVGRCRRRNTYVVHSSRTRQRVAAPDVRPGTRAWAINPRGVAGPFELDKSCVGGQIVESTPSRTVRYYLTLNAGAGSVPCPPQTPENQPQRLVFSCPGAPCDTSAARASRRATATIARSLGSSRSSVTRRGLRQHAWPAGHGASSSRAWQDL